MADRLQRCALVLLAILLMSPRFTVAARLNSAVANEAQPVSDNVVLSWNRAALTAIRNTRTSPPVAARALAIAHTCIFDAWAAYDATAIGTQRGVELRQPPSQRTEENKKKAISFAALRALSDVFPSQTEILFDPLMRQLGYEPGETSLDLTSPAAIGNTACESVLAFRHSDGSNQLGDLHPESYSDYTGYSPVNSANAINDPNRWQPLRVNNIQQRFLLPHWRLVKPFALQSGSQFRSYALSRGPFSYPSANYWAEAYAVIDLSAHLGDTEKVIAEYWADGPFTETPPGHWNLFAQIVSRRDNHSLDEDVKLFFMLNNALLDSSIVAWDIKRATDSIRPVSVIRLVLPADRKIRAWAGPGLGVQVISCKDFRSYLPTPPFPTYVSGHSAFSAAAAEILRLFSGRDDFGYSYTAAPGSSLIEPGLTPSRSITIYWSTFTEAADQAGLSRRYGGIHFESDDLVGRSVGRLVAAEVWKKANIYINGSRGSSLGMLSFPKPIEAKGPYGRRKPPLSSLPQLQYLRGDLWD